MLSWKFLLSCLLFAFFLGCGSDERLTFQDPVAASGGDGDHHKDLLVHDFGDVFPESQLKHQFTLQNDTSAPWRIASFHSSCKCTVGEATSRLIPANSTGQINVDFIASTTPRKEESTVWVFFEENARVPLGLVVRATVREKVELSRRRIVTRLQLSRAGGEIEEQLDVISRGQSTLEKLRLVSSHEWVAGDYALMRFPDPNAQLFRVLAIIDTQYLGPGRHTAKLRIEGISSAGHEPVLLAVVPVELTLYPDIEADPPQLFFPTVQAGTVVKRHFVLTVHSSSSVIDVTRSDLKLEHSLGDLLHLSVQRQSRDAWKVTATLSAPHEPGILHDDLQVKVRQFDQPLVIPMAAQVVSDPGR